MSLPHPIRSGRRLFCAAALLVLAACSSDGPTDPVPVETSEYAVVLNSVDLSLSVFDVESPTEVTTVGLAPEGSPVSMAVRDGTVVVPLGFVPALAVVDLVTGVRTSTIALPEGSGATGVAFLDDTRVLVANPSLNSVSPVDLVTGVVGDPVAVGGYPQGVVLVGDRVFVLNAELGADFLPTGPGTVTVLDAASLAVIGDVALSGENPAAAAVGPDGNLWVVNSGRFFGENGSVSVVDPVTLTELSHHEGFGDFPGTLAFDPSGVLYTSSFSYGIAVWSSVSDAFQAPPTDAVAPEGTPSTSGIGFDASGRLWALRPTCGEPSAALLLDATHEVADTVPVGVCPIAIAFTEVEDS